MGPIQHPIRKVAGTSFSRGKAARAVNHLLPSSAEVKNGGAILLHVFEHKHGQLYLYIC